MAYKAGLRRLTREAMYNPNWPMDAASKPGANPAAASTPPAVSFWLEKRAASVRITPSTFGAGINTLDV